jgi:hypothetical protein
MARRISIADTDVAFVTSMKHAKAILSEIDLNNSRPALKRFADRLRHFLRSNATKNRRKYGSFDPSKVGEGRDFVDVIGSCDD